MKKIVIIGMGFGGLRAAAELSGRGFEVVVLDRHNFHLFQPLLYQVATAMLDQESIVYSIRSIVSRFKGVRFRMSEVKGVDFQKKQVQTSDGAIDYDYLILAAGSVTNFFGNDSIRQHAFDLKQLQDAVVLRNHVLGVFERAAKEPDPAVRAALMTFVIVGGGPTGVEFAGSMSELTHAVLTRDFPELHPEKSRLILLDAGDKLLAAFPEPAQKYALKKLRSMGVEVRFSTSVVAAEADCVHLEDGTSIASHTMFWAAGVVAAPLAAALGLPTAKGGRIPVEVDLSLKEYPEVFVIGDMAYREQDGKALPGVAPVAMQGGHYVAKAIAAHEQNREIKPFHYVDKGSMAVIGRYRAVASTFGVTVNGFAAWVAWLGLHLYYLIGFRNRLVTLLNWAYDYFLFNRQVRLITDERKSDVV